MAPAGLASAGSTMPETAASPAATAAPGSPARKTHFLYEKYRNIVPSPVPATLAALYASVLFLSSPYVVTAITISAMASPTTFSATNSNPSRSKAWLTRCRKVQNRLPR